MIIYFIQVENDGAIKIGQTKDVQERLRALQHSHYQKLNILFSFDVPDEKANYVENHIHNCFRHYRLRGEWFQAKPYMYDYIAAIGKNGFWVNGMDEMHEYCVGDKFAETYNRAFHIISRAREYGDYRRIKDIINDLKLLKEYAETGKIS